MPRPTLPIALFAIAFTAALQPAIAWSQQEDDPDEPAPSEPPPEEKPPAPAPEEKPATPAPETAPATPAPSSPPAPPSTGSPASNITWTMLAAMIPDRGGILQGEVGFSGLGRIAYHQSLSDALSVGALVAFDYAGYRTDAVFTSRMIIAAPIRYAVALSDTLVVGLRGDPGVVIPFAGGFGIQLDLQAHIGWIFEQRFVFGPGIDMPIELQFAGGKGALAWPILIGGVFEYHVAPPFALTLDAKVGPSLSTSGGFAFGLRAHGGLAYRF